MKNKWYIISIILIIFFGVSITIGTKNFVTGQENSLYLNEDSVPDEEEKNFYPRSEISIEEKQQDVQNQQASDFKSSVSERMIKVEPDESQKTSVAVNEEVEEENTEQTERIQEESPVEISPLTGALQNGDIEEDSGVSKKEYEKRLKDIDIRIQKMREANVGSIPDSCKNMTEYEYRLWDNELNAIYQDILKQMTEEEITSLRDEERKWIVQKDTDARKAGEKYRGTIECVEYTASLTKSTRERAYQLLEDYGTYLE